MRSLSQIILLLILSIGLYAQSPHGSDLTIACADCHIQKGWKLEAGTYVFDHQKTQFPLEGSHKDVYCTKCHTSLVFSEAKTECISCHTDMHYQTVGTDCGRCHTPKSWIVNNITEIHQQSRFPLVGAHLTADCYSCHPSASLLRFEPLGIECFDCHKKDYEATTNPNHVTGNFSTNCTDCHLLNAFTWGGTNFTHAFFPLTEGHEIFDCKECHKDQNNYSNISSECLACHQTNFNATTNPNHIAADIPTDCKECHTTAPGWKPAEFKQHDGQYFPIYSGKHRNEWDLCSDCHTSPNNFAVNSCIVCHNNQGELNSQHGDVGGYEFNDPACFACHPTGDAEGGFNHNNTNFPLTGAHTTVDCALCHVTGYPGTTTVCGDCHANDYNQTNNPNHTTAEISTDCATCHTTAPGWVPASFGNHEVYPLTGGHATIANDCFSCHNGDYNNTPTVCFGCHAPNYNQTTNPNHLASGIPNDCAMCHTTNPDWKPATFPIHNDVYPLTGAHATIAEDCFSCHNGDYTSTPNVCFGCHSQNYSQTTNPNHNAIGIPTDCETCHTTNPDWKPAVFPNHDGYYVIAGAHLTIANDCGACHNGNYVTTPNTCFGCHETNYNQTNNPSHQTAQFPTDCESCHTQSAWVPSTFDHDGQYFPIYSGKHNGKWDLCSDCHTDPSNYAIFTCITCHQAGETNSQHEGISGYVYNSDACLACHPDGSGGGAFDHSNTGFPLTGAHIGLDCIACHENGYSGTSTNCADCHDNNYNQTTNPNHNVIGIPNDCASCHTTNPGWTPATFPIHSNYYQLTGGHATIANNCFSCHNGNYNTTSTVCFDCHSQNYNQTTNPNHSGIGIPDECATCHTTNPGWAPATFPIHSNYYVLQGAHVSIANDCAACHSGNYNTTPITCFGCHQNNYNQTTNPPHLSAQFPTNCETCHTQTTWIPSTFDHDGQYFPIYSGNHHNAWDQCSDCHNDPNNYAVFTCLTCHGQNQMNNEHNGVSGYQYNSEACYSCHPTGGGGGSKKLFKQIKD